MVSGYHILIADASCWAGKVTGFASTASLQHSVRLCWIGRRGYHPSSLLSNTAAINDNGNYVINMISILL